jgi:cytochrome c biogenesis protein CcdA/thiol-disulfide isomerase/thioredoxin
MHLIEIGLSFIEGLALIASPCILPVLPLVLATSVDGGRRRPFGIIIGFILAFTVFALLSRALVNILHLNLDYIKYGSLILLAIFGVIMLSEALLSKFGSITQSFANSGTTLSANARDGYLSGILIGVLIGLVWTPCAGPILAVALVQIIRQQNSLNAMLLILAFAIGAGVPMLIISLTGRRLMTKLKFLYTHPSLVHKTLGVLVLLAVGFIASGLDAKTLFSKSTINNSVSKAVLQDRIQKAVDEPYPAPQFALSDIWLNTPENKPLAINSLKGKVVLIDFWTYSCINCIRTLPYLRDWYQKYQANGLVVVGVHAPEFEFEKDKTNVINAIARYGIKYPVAQDNNLDTWTNYNNRYWPAHYLIDKNGNVVYTSFGEGDYDVTENNIRVLLGLGRGNTNNGVDLGLNMGQTPETYLGYARAENFGGVQEAATDAIKVYSLPGAIPADHWALSGKWLIEGQRIISKEMHARLVLNFTARHVYLVLGNPSGRSIKLNLKLNGKPVGNVAGKDAPNGVITVSGHRLYELINQGEVKNGLLEIDVSESGLEAYAFTFG